MGGLLFYPPCFPIMAYPWEPRAPAPSPRSWPGPVAEWRPPGIRPPWCGHRLVKNTQSAVAFRNFPGKKRKTMGNMWYMVIIDDSWWLMMIDIDWYWWFMDFLMSWLIHMWKVLVMWETLGRCFMELFDKMYNLCITNRNRQSSISFRNWGHTPNGPWEKWWSYMIIHGNRNRWQFDGQKPRVSDVYVKVKMLG